MSSDATACRFFTRAGGKWPLLSVMTARLLRSRFAAAASAAAGSALLAVSAVGVASLDGSLREAERRSAPARLIEELGPCPHAEDRLCARHSQGPMREI